MNRVRRVDVDRVRSVDVDRVRRVPTSRPDVGQCVEQCRTRPCAKATKSK